jgi:hypothetical protein
VDQFAKEINAFVKKAGVKFNEAYRVQLINLYIDIVDGTPRDTGTLKNNWFFGTKVDPSNKNPKAEYAIGAESAQVFRAIANAKTVSIRDTIFIYNPLPYAEAIEKGLGKGNRKAWRMAANAIAHAQGKLIVSEA